MLILIHEFGHFIAAKLLGVKVNEFAVGFGPKLLSKKGKETTYKLNLVPFGGYCAMEGEDENSSDSRAFCNQKAWKRLIITAMGAIFNLILGFILIAVYLCSTPIASTTVSSFAEGAVSNSKLMVNDKIVSVEGRPVWTCEDLSYAFTGVEDGMLDMTVVRDGKRVKLEDVKFATQKINGISYVSIDFIVYRVEKNFGNVIEYTFKTTAANCRVIWYSLIDLIGGKYGLSAVSGPVGVTEAIGQVAKESLLDLLPLMALITVNLGIFNLLPIPALDGGRIFFLLIEMITRKKIPQRYETAIHAAGLILLLSFMLVITFKDIMAFF